MYPNVKYSFTSIKYFNIILQFMQYDSLIRKNYIPHTARLVMNTRTKRKVVYYDFAFLFLYSFT